MSAGLDSMRRRIARARERVGEVALVRRSGTITRLVGLGVESRGPQVAVGEECRLETAAGEFVSHAEVVGFEGSRILTMPVDEVRGLRRGDRVIATGRQPVVPAGDGLLGRVIDALGQPIDGKGPLGEVAWRPVHGESIAPLERPRIEEPMATGVRAIDAFLTLGRGQRIGIFAGSGVGKSRLMGNVARHASDEVVVIGLVGERNREVREFVEQDLGEGLARAVVVVATSDEPPVRRVRCALAATAIAEEFRRRGRNVTLLMDSLTRVAMALREIGLSAGEPPSSKGYPPSVFAFLPRLLERAGREAGAGSMTGIYTVFVEADDMNEPIADHARSILDGHVVLSRSLAERSHYPAIDVLGSISRVMPQVTSEEHQRAALRVRRLMAIYRDNEDLVSIGAYREGIDPELDAAVRWHRPIRDFLRQEGYGATPFEETVARLLALGVDGEAD